MAEGSCPQVFVVDCPTSFVQPPMKKKPIWRRASKRLLGPLLALVMFGLVVEGIFIFRLYKKTEAFSLFLNPNQSSPQTPALDGKTLKHVGPGEHNEIYLGTVQPKKLEERPRAHLQGSSADSLNGVVQWDIHDGFVSHIGFNNSGLVIEKEGFYYIYCKVHLQEDCVMVNHRVLRNTTSYMSVPIELMKSKSFHCSKNQKPNEKNLWNSFLAGIFKFDRGDVVFVKLDKGLYPGPADNFLGAFMID